MAAGEVGQSEDYGCYSDDDENDNNQALSCNDPVSHPLGMVWASVYSLHHMYEFTFDVQMSRNNQLTQQRRRRSPLITVLSNTS